MLAGFDRAFRHAFLTRPGVTKSTENSTSDRRSTAGIWDDDGVIRKLSRSRSRKRSCADPESLLNMAQILSVLTSDQQRIGTPIVTKPLTSTETLVDCRHPM